MIPVSHMTQVTHMTPVNLNYNIIITLIPEMMLMTLVATDHSQMIANQPQVTQMTPMSN